MDDEEPPMEVVIRLVDRGLPKNRSQRVALNAAYSAKHADARHSVFCQSPFTRVQPLPFAQRVTI